MLGDRAVIGIALAEQLQHGFRFIGEQVGSVFLRERLRSAPVWRLNPGNEQVGQDLGGIQRGGFRWGQRGQFFNLMTKRRVVLQTGQEFLL